jgi:hypothetical protein
MATGLQTANTNPRSVIIRVAEALTAASAANAIPTYASAGVDLVAELNKVFATKSAPKECLIHAYNTAGTDTVAAKIRLWGGDNISAAYGVVGIGPATTAGYLNGGASLDEIGTDRIGRYETLTLPACLDKVTADIPNGTLTGTSVSINVDLIFQFAEGA